MTLLSGSRLGPYEIIALVGVGGMGEVYRARDTRLDRTVAIKILPAHLAGGPGARERFAREARAISSVEHPSICTLYDLGSERLLHPSSDPAQHASDGDLVQFLVMQYIEGETLHDRISRGPVPMEEALALAVQIAAGLEAAHDRGVLHRDLKPSNIKVTSTGDVKILDFGLAKALDTATSSSNGRLSGTMTEHATELGIVLGTASYMSPEQARGLPVDRRADIWAFGCVLFEMVTGTRAFAGDTTADVLANVLSREPDWTALPAGTPEAVRLLLHRCLRKLPERRLRDAGDVRLELEETQSAESDPRAGPTRDSSRRRSAKVAWTVASVAVLIGATALAALVFGFGRSRPIVSRPPMRFSGITNFAGVEAQPSFSPDGRSIAFVSNRDGQWDVYVGLVAGGNLVRITNDPNLESRPRWSPDGSRLLFTRLDDSGVFDAWIVPALGGASRRILTNARDATWSPDARAIAYSSDGRIWIADAEGGNAHAVTQAESPLAHFQPAFSRDSRRIAFSRRREGPYGELAVVDVQSGAVSRLTDDGALVMSPVWSSDDRFIYFTSSRGGTLNVWKVDIATRDLEQITAGQGDDADIDLSADGNRLAFSSYHLNQNLARMDLDPATKGARTWLTTDPVRGENAPRYSRDGQHIAYFSNRSGAERESIWAMDADGGNASSIVADGLVNLHPHWTAHDHELVFASRRLRLEDEARLRRVSLGGGAPSDLPIVPWSTSGFDVTPDGRIIYRRSPSAGEVYDLHTGAKQPVGDLRGDPLWSADGRYFAFIVPPDASRPADAGVWVGTVDGVRRQVFSGWVMSIAWTSGGEVLVLQAKASVSGALWEVSSTGERRMVLEPVATLVRHFAQGTLVRFDVAPDRHHIVVEALESFESDIGMIENVR